MTDLVARIQAVAAELERTLREKRERLERAWPAPHDVGSAATGGLLMERLEQAERVWADLAAELGCTSPDGSAELGQVRYLKELLAAEQVTLAEAHNLLDDYNIPQGSLVKRIDLHVELACQTAAQQERERRARAEQERDGHKRGAAKLTEVAANNLARAERAEKERDALANAIAPFRHTLEDRELWQTEDGGVNIDALVLEARDNRELTNARVEVLTAAFRQASRELHEAHAIQFAQYHKWEECAADTCVQARTLIRGEAPTT